VVIPLQNVYVLNRWPQSEPFIERHAKIGPMTAVRRARVGLARIMGLGLLLAAMGCGGSSGEDGPRRFNDDDATLLANALFSNYESGGGTFRIVVQVAPGASIAMEGVVDWKNHRGHATVVGQGKEEGVQEVYWSETSVLERRDAVNAVLAQTGRDGITFVARPVDTSRYLDEVIASVAGVASQQRDNPQLLQQSEESEYLREDVLRDVPVTVLRYDKLTTYWLAADDGRMLRLEGNNTPGTRPLVLDILTQGPQTIDGPAVDAVIGVEEIQDIYDGFVAADG
jgi:hypothetical protein